MPREATLTPNPSNVRWKTLSFEFYFVVSLSEYLEAHPERGYKGVSDFVISKLRDDPEVVKAYAEYAIKHGLKHPDEGEIKAKIKEMDALLEEYRAKECEYQDKKTKLEQITTLLKEL